MVCPLPMIYRARDATRWAGKRSTTVAGTARVAESLVLGDVDWHIVRNVHQQHVNSALTRFVKRNKQFLWFLREQVAIPVKQVALYPFPEPRDAYDS